MIETPSLVDLVAGRSYLGGARHLNISDAAEKAFAEIYQRWADLDAWDVRIKVPAVVKRPRTATGEDPSIAEYWDAFKVRWQDNPDIAELQAAGDDLHTAEGLAKDAGYNDDKPLPPQVQVPDVVTGTQTTQTAEQIDEAAKAAQKAAAEAGSSLWSSTPWWVKAGLLVGGGALVIGAVRK